MEHGGDINGVDNKGETVIHGAAYKIDHGAKIEIWNQKNKTGWTSTRFKLELT